jgi:uncharacterized membrane protein
MKITTENQRASAPGNISVSRLLVMIAFYGLVLTFSIKTMVAIIAGGNPAAAVAVWVFQTAPLLIFIPGLHARHLRTFAWLSFVSLIYFIPSVLTAFQPDALYYGLLLSLLCTVLFSGLVAYIHLVRKYAGGTLQN